MLPRFVQVQNVKRFIRAVDKLEGRAAQEACIVLATGQAGFGKSGTGLWWATQNDAVFLRVKAAATPHWILNDLVVELGESAPASSCEKLFGQAVGTLAKNRRPIVVDEVENGLGNIKVLETIRDISDLVEVPVVFIGREYVWGKLKRYAHFKTRVAEAVTFLPTSVSDVRLCAEQLLDKIKVQDDLIQEIAMRSEGHIREVVKALQNVERAHGANGPGKMALADMKGQPLVVEPMRRDPASERAA